MSYILEALKKSQQERELGLVPAAPAETPPLGRSRSALGRHTWGYFSLALAVVAILISLYGLVQGRFSEPSGASGSVPREASVAPADAEPPGSAPALQPAPAPGVDASADQVRAAKPGRRGSVPPAPADPEPALAKGLATGSQGTPQGQAAPPPAAPGAELLAPPGAARDGSGGGVVVSEEAPTPVTGGGASSPRPNVPRTPRPAPKRAETAASRPAPGDSKPVAPSASEGGGSATTDALEQRVKELAAAAERQIAVASAPAAATDSGLDRAPPVRPPRKLPPGPSRLPPAVFRALPETRVLVHVYVDQPGQRFVILNSRKLREGDTSPEGLGMQEILPNGVILSFQGHRFFIPR